MYKKLPFEQYFIDTSKDYHHTGTARYKIKYNHVEYKGLLFKHSAEYEMHYEEDRNVIQINFEQTHGKVDWIDNLTFPKKYYGTFKYNNKKVTLRVHSAWGRMYKAMKHLIRDDFLKLYKDHMDADVEIIGWSLGSGQAQLCAQDLFFNFKIKSHLYTFGSVKPFFGGRIVRNYLKECCHEVYNFSINNDIVTYMVPFLGWFKINNVPVSINKFHIYRLFNPKLYHTCYDRAKVYKNIK